MPDFGGWMNRAWKTRKRHRKSEAKQREETQPQPCSYQSKSTFSIVKKLAIEAVVSASDLWLFSVSSFTGSREQVEVAVRLYHCAFSHFSLSVSMSIGECEVGLVDRSIFFRGEGEGCKCTVLRPTNRPCRLFTSVRGQYPLSRDTYRGGTSIAPRTHLYHLVLHGLLLPQNNGDPQKVVSTIQTNRQAEAECFGVSRVRVQ